MKSVLKKVSSQKLEVRGSKGFTLVELLYHRRKQEGFTLVELLIVIAIIGILMGFLSLSFFGVRQRTQDSQRKTDLKLLQSALEQYRSDNDEYITDIDYNAIGCATPFIDGSGVIYMQSTPCDPDDSMKKYFYHSYNSGFSYVLVSCIENEDDASSYTTASSPSFWADTGATWPPISCNPDHYFVVQNP